MLSIYLRGTAFHEHLTFNAFNSAKRTNLIQANSQKVLRNALVCSESQLSQLRAKLRPTLARNKQTH